jgi:hypothetical protein
VESSLGKPLLLDLDTEGRIVGMEVLNASQHLHVASHPYERMRRQPAAVVISVADLELLETPEDARDAADFTAAKADDDGTRVSIAELRELTTP